MRIATESDPDTVETLAELPEQYIDELTLDIMNTLSDRNPKAPTPMLWSTLTGAVAMPLPWEI